MKKLKKLEKADNFYHSLTLEEQDDVEFNFQATLNSLEFECYSELIGSVKKKDTFVLVNSVEYDPIAYKFASTYFSYLLLKNILTIILLLSFISGALVSIVFNNFWLLTSVIILPFALLIKIKPENGRILAVLFTIVLGLMSKFEYLIFPFIYILTTEIVTALKNDYQKKLLNTSMNNESFLKVLMYLKIVKFIKKEDDGSNKGII